MPLKGWKTLGFNLIMLAIGSPELLALLPPEIAIYVGTIGNLLLRAISNTPIGRAK